MMELQAFPILFLVIFPSSVYLWSILLVDSGFIHDVARMPWEVRLAGRVAGLDRSGRRRGALVVTIACLAFVNFPVAGVLVRPYGLVTSVAAATYVVVELAWLLRIRLAVRRIDRREP
jgi:hypothetical protein